MKIILLHLFIICSFSTVVAQRYSYVPVTKSTEKPGNVKQILKGDTLIAEFIVQSRGETEFELSHEISSDTIYLYYNDDFNEEYEPGFGMPDPALFKLSFFVKVNPKKKYRLIPAYLYKPEDETENEEAEAENILTVTECDEKKSADLGAPPKILSIKKQDDVTILVLDVPGNCCSIFIGVYSSGDKEIFLDYEETGDQCECNCRYEMSFSVPSRDYRETVYLNGKKITK
jgi:hypothetical protein